MYYQQCYEVAQPIVKHYFTDVTTHDKAALETNTDDIIYALRETGSNLILLDGKHTRQNAMAAEVFTFTPNDHFYLGNAGKLREVTKAKALDVWLYYRRINKIT